MFSCQTQVRGYVLLTPRHVWLCRRAGRRHPLCHPPRFGDVLCSGKGLSRGPRGPVPAHPKRYPAPGMGRMPRRCPRGCVPISTGFRAAMSGTGVSAMGRHNLPGLLRFPISWGCWARVRSAEKPFPGQTICFLQPCSGRDVPSPSALSSRGRTLASLTPRPAAEGVNGAEQVLVAPAAGWCEVRHPPPLSPQPSQAAPSLFVRFRKAATIKMHCSISAPSAPEPEQNPRSCRPQPP